MENETEQPTEEDRQKPEETTPDSEEKTEDKENGENVQLPANVSREQLLEIYKKYLEVQAAEEFKNRLLQARLSEHFSKTQFDAPDEILSLPVSLQEAKYRENAEKITSLLQEIADLVAYCDARVKKLEEMAEEKKGDLPLVNEEYYDLVRRVALRAVDSTTGQRIPKEVVDAYLKKLMEMEHIKYDTYLKHLIDLKSLQRIQKSTKTIKHSKCPMTLNEYEVAIAETNIFECRAMEKKKVVMQLRMNCLDTVNVISHLKHLLYFTAKEKVETKARIKFLQVEVDRMTTELLKMKAKHEQTKLESQRLREKFTMVKDDLLPDDYEDKKVAVQELCEKVEKLKEKYHRIKEENQRRRCS